MFVDDELRNRVDGLLFGSHLGLAGAPRLIVRFAASAAGADDQPVELALWEPFKRGLEGTLASTGVQTRFDRTVGQMTGGSLTPAEIHELEHRALTHAEMGDVKALTGITEGPPVYVSPQQKQTIDKLMGQMGSDNLAKRARGAYQGAFRAGQIRVR